MDSGRALRDARRRAGLTQTELAARARTSQATISAYESGGKVPSVDTLDRLLAAAGSRLGVEPATVPVLQPSAAEHARVGRALRDEKLLELHRGLARRRLPHAFGGAIALAYWTLDPRGTSDIDVNVFLPAVNAAPALHALPVGVAQPAGSAGVIAREGQIRLWWDETPVDLFFDHDAPHRDAARHRRIVPFAGTRIPILGPTELAVFKATHDRTRDWADIEAMLVARTLDLDAVRETLETLVPAADERLARLDEALRRAGAPA